MRQELVFPEMRIIVDNMCYHIYTMRAKHTTGHRDRARKHPKSFSLSADVVEALQEYQRQRKTESLTAAFEEIVREWQKAQVEGQFVSYYDSLSDKERQQEREWGGFSESQM